MFAEFSFRLVPLGSSALVMLDATVVLLLEFLVALAGEGAFILGPPAASDEAVAEANDPERVRCVDRLEATELLEDLDATELLDEEEVLATESEPPGLDRLLFRRERCIILLNVTGQRYKVSAIDFLLDFGWDENQ